MNIYIDESYNLQKDKGKIFISINGFAVLDEKILRKRWRAVRKPYAKSRRRIHATDSHFDGLREVSIKMLGRHDVNILSVFQLVQQIPHEYFEPKGMNFDEVYAGLVKKLLSALSLGEYQKVRIIIDARKHKGGKLAHEKFKNNIKSYLMREFSTTKCEFKMTHSYMDILVELADFVSNIFYKEYQSGSDHVFEKLGFRFVQIKNPL